MTYLNDNYNLNGNINQCHSKAHCIYNKYYATVNIIVFLAHFLKLFMKFNQLAAKRF